MGRAHGKRMEYVTLAVLRYGFRERHTEKPGRRLTMAEYIEREAAVKVAEKYGLANGSALGRHTGLADCIASEIADIPAADVAPVVHGRWIHYPDCGVTRCSHCGWSIDECWESKRCPECGAKMDGAE